MPAKPLGLSDTQFTRLIAACDQLHPRDRDRFLRQVAGKFSGRDDLGDGEFSRGLAELLAGEIFKPMPGSPPMAARSRRVVGPPIA
jgi:hypothetical protein